MRWIKRKEEINKEKISKVRKRGQKTREKIIKVATKLFGKYGFAGTSMDEISEKVGIKKASLYHHFPSKQDIYFELIDKVLTEILDIFQISFTSDDIIKDSEMFFEKIMDYISKNQDYIKILVRELLDENIPIRQLSQEYVPKLLNFGEKIIGEGVRKGIFREGIDPIQLSVTLTGAVLIYFLFIPILDPFIPNPLSKKSIETRVKHMVDIFLNGIILRNK
ncbi:MAG: TetR/AcrR family transcriptional regulator [Candidatus Calescibacterium sp.]|nr:TetR/AcrR family transcriptional regulator [Candidatus Calescibacterium sp.]MCX7734064.1 TetR/AcrR family transcriptional regulator [bacterium]